jgi:putative transposase
MIIFERYSRLRRNFKGNSFWARGYYVNTVGLDEAKIRRYIKNQQSNESVMDAYNSDLDQDPFKGASIEKEDTDK